MRERETTEFDFSRRILEKEEKKTYRPASKSKPYKKRLDNRKNLKKNPKVLQSQKEI